MSPLHSFYSTTNFCLIYSVSTLWVCKSSPGFYYNSAPHNNVLQVQKPLSRVSSYFCSFTSLFKTHLQNWQQKVYRRQDLLFESHWKYELWKQGHTSYIGPISFPTLQNPFIWPTPEEPGLCVPRKLRVEAERKHRAALWVGLERGCQKKVGATWRHGALGEIFRLGNSIKLAYGFPGKWGLKFSFQLTDRESLEQ